MLEIEYIKINELKPFTGNPRKIDDDEMKKLRRSIKEYGFVDPIIVRKETNQIIGGHQRVEAAKLEKLNKVPVVYLEGLSNEKAILLNIALNKISGEFDWPKLGDLFAELDTGDIDLTMSGFDLDEIGDLMHGLDEADHTEEDEVPEPPEDPISKTGDLWLLGKHRLLCGDSTKAEDVERLMGGEKADIMLTDPPYGVDYANLVKSRKNQKKGGWPDIKGDAVDDKSLEALLQASLGGAGANIAFVWHPPGAKRKLFWSAVEYSGWKVAQEIVWVKNALVFGRSDYQWRHEPCLYLKRNGAGKQKDRTQTTVWEVNKPHNSEHPTQKPVELFAIPLRNHTSKGCCVFDPFVGSGTTIIAAEQLGRKCYACEIDPRYVDVAVKRWENLTNKTAKLEVGEKAAAGVA